MGIQAWVVRKLREERHDVSPIGDHAVRVLRRGDPDVVAYCPEPGPDPFTAADLDQAIREQPDVDALIMIRRSLAAGVFEQATHQGLLVGRLGEFERSLSIREVSLFQHPDEIYLRRRILRSPHATGVIRVGMRAWRIAREDPLRDLTFVTHDRYEFTDDELWDLVEQHPGVNPDAFVITNPNAHGFGLRVSRSASGLGIAVCTFDDFLHLLGDDWS